MSYMEVSAEMPITLRTISSASQQISKETKLNHDFSYLYVGIKMWAAPKIRHMDLRHLQMLQPSENAWEFTAG